MERILIVRLGAMGDVVHGLPAAAALRAAAPEAHIGWAIEERWMDLLCARGTPLDARRSPQKPLVDSIHPVNTKSWRSQWASASTWNDIRAFRKSLRQPGYGAAIDLQGSIKSAMVVRASGAARRIGPADPRETPARLFYTEQITTASRHVIERYAELTRAAVGEASNPNLISEFPRDHAAETWCEGEIQRRGLQRFAMLNPGAGWGAKLWPPERYGEVARVLATEGVRSLINIGTGEEAMAAAVEASSAGAAQRITCAIGELIALTRRASLFIGGDTGPMHLAAALAVPVVAIFGPTDPARNGPYYTPHIVLRSSQSATSYSHRKTADAGLLSIASDEVVRAARRLLAGSAG